ncbi:MAG TPA: hypothetical protein VEO01_16800, partial [Pseudonocardiaceae bacterium]|nr:hypothetical protein [Pseudonocardiaceae bacterium]
MTISSAAAFATSTGTALTTQAVTATAVNDLWVVFIVVKSASITTTGVSGGGATGWVDVTGNWLDGTGTANESVWIGTMNATGAQTITFTYSGSVTGIAMDIDAHPFHSTLASPVWTPDGFGTLSNASSTTVSFPTLAPSIDTVNGELYWGHSRVPGSAGTPLPSGFVANSDANGNPEMYNVAVTGSVSPTMTQTAGISNSIAIMVSDHLALVPAQMPQRPVLRITGPSARRRPAQPLSSSIPVVAVSLTDSGAGSDALAVAVPLADTGAGADSLALATAVVDTGAGTDSLTPAVAFTDSGTAADALALSVPLADSGTAADTSAFTILIADTGAGSDTLTVVATIPLPDTGAGSDTLVITVPLADAGTGADAVSAAPALPDSGTGSDSLTALVVPLADSGTASNTIVIAIGLADSGTGADSLTASITVALSDSGTGSDALSVTIPLTDSGT